MTMLRTLLKPPGYVPGFHTHSSADWMTVEPQRVVIPLEYPGQILYRPLVQPGDTVRRNQIIGKSEFGNCVHASISGVIDEIKSMWTARGFNVPAVAIEGNGEPPLALEEMFLAYGIPFASASPTQKMQVCGVISPWTLPGRFHREEDVERFPEVKHIVVKGADEETTISIWERLLCKSAPIRRGLTYLTELAPRATIWLTVPKVLADWATEEFGNSVKIAVRSPEYKDRIEQLVVSHLTGVRVPNESPYRAKGVAVISVEYLLNMVDALDGSTPFVDKHLTVATHKMVEPVNVTAPIGTPIGYVLDRMGIQSKEYARLLVGGPMKGVAQFTDLTPVTKSSHGVFLASREELANEVNLPCITCGRCTQVCPVNLQVHLIGRNIEYEMPHAVEALHPEACIECGLCAYVCPAHRPLVQLLRIAKQVQGEDS